MSSYDIQLDNLNNEIIQEIKNRKIKKRPILLTNKNKPEAVILDYEEYQSLISSPIRVSDENTPYINTKCNELLNFPIDRVVDLEDAYIELMLATVNVMENHQSYLSGHHERVALLSIETARQIGLSDEVIENIRWAALLLDLGEMIIPTDVLQKSTILTNEERKIIKDHPYVGAKFLRWSNRMNKIAHIIYAHQERYDGSGYPRGLKGDQIPLESRIISVADTYDAMTNVRLHRDSFSHEKAIAEIQRNSNILFDPEVVSTFINIF